MNASSVSPGDPDAQHAAAGSRFGRLHVDDARAAHIDRLRLAVPDVLQQLRQWVVFKFGPPKTNGKRDKLPYYPGTGVVRHGVQGSAEDRAQLGTFDEALAALESGRYDGVGFAMLPDAGIVGIDLDDCLDDQRNPRGLAAEIVNAGDTYAEISPSGKGLRLFYRGAMPDKKNHGAGVELFHGAGFLTVTGDRINDADIQELPETLKARLLECVGATESSDSKRRDWTADAEPGQRYDALNAYVWRHFSEPIPLPIYEIWQKLGIYNATHCTPPHAEDELKRIFTQALADLKEKQPEAYRRLMGGAAPEGGALGLDIIDFIADYAPPDGVVEGIVQRNYVHGITSLTNHGKTAVGSTMILAVTTGRSFAGHEVEQGLAYVLCGENPFDFKGRLIGTMQELGIDPAEVKGRIRVVGQAFPLAAQIARIKEEIRAWGDVVLVFVDTSVAYFSGDDEDSNVQARAHAQTLRELTLLPSRPAVVVACHPVKNATRDNLVPRGGSAFLNEIDTNLTVWAEDEVATLHWHRKIRGAPFEPLQFRLVRKVIEGSTNAKGKPGTAGVAVPIAEHDAEALAKRGWHDENRLLDAMLRHPKESIASWAYACGWTVGTDSKPHKSKVARLLEKLARDKLVKHYRSRWTLTRAGRSEAKQDA